MFPQNLIGKLDGQTSEIEWIFDGTSRRMQACSPLQEPLKPNFKYSFSGRFIEDPKVQIKIAYLICLDPETQVLTAISTKSGALPWGVGPA